MKPRTATKPDPAMEPDPMMQPDPTMEPEPAGNTEPPFGADADVLTWSTDQFSLDAGQERYLCFAKTIDEDAVVNAYASDVQPFVHHLIFSRATAPEPDGFAECDVAFRSCSYRARAIPSSSFQSTRATSCPGARS